MPRLCPGNVCARFKPTSHYITNSRPFQNLLFLWPHKERFGPSFGPRQASLLRDLTRKWRRMGREITNKCVCFWLEWNWFVHLARDHWEAWPSLECAMACVGKHWHWTGQDTNLWPILRAEWNGQLPEEWTWMDKMPVEWGKNLCFAGWVNKNCA